MPKDPFTLSDVREPTLTIVCQPCGERGRYAVSRLMEKYGNARLTDLRHTLANCEIAWNVVPLGGICRFES
jgi:hypothetical protein